MKSVMTLTREKIKHAVVLLDYLFWLLFDPSKFTTISSQKIRRVLIIHLGAMGELLTIEPVIATLKRRRNCDIEILVRKGNQSVFANHPDLDEVLIYEQDDAKILTTLKQKKFDLALIATPSTRNLAHLCYKAGIPYRFGGVKDAREGLSLFFTRRNYPINRKHVIHFYMDMLRPLNIADENPEIVTHLTLRDKQKPTHFFTKNNIKEKDYIIIHPGFSFSVNTKYPARLWPLERYATVIDYLSKKYNKPILISGAPGEEKLAEDIKDKVKDQKNVHIVAGQFNYNEFAYVVSQAALVIGPSTLVVPLSTSFNTPLVQLTGSEDTDQWFPRHSKKNFIMLFHNEVCTNCTLNDCRLQNQECMTSIGINEVIKAADELLTPAQKSS